MPRVPDYASNSDMDGLDQIPDAIAKKLGINPSTITEGEKIVGAVKGFLKPKGTPSGLPAIMPGPAPTFAPTTTGLSLWQWVAIAGGGLLVIGAVAYYFKMRK